VKLISAGAFVRLVFLSLQRNCLSDLSVLSGKSLGNLQVLNISDNGISSWEQVFKLENFEKCIHPLSSPYLSSLKELYLEKNMIREIFPCKNAMLPNLVKLSLNDNPFLSLETLELLDCFPNLQVLDFQRTPLADNLGVRSVRSDLIALLPRLKTVNRSEVLNSVVLFDFNRSLTKKDLTLSSLSSETTVGAPMLVEPSCETSIASMSSTQRLIEQIRLGSSYIVCA